MTEQRAVIWIAVSSEAQTKPDKASLDTQEKACSEWCRANGYEIVRVLRWDGYSRSETDVITAYEDFATQGRYEYHDLRKMWQEHAFDVFVVYIHDRIARSPALYAQVMSNVIRSGARIFSLSDGWIDQNNIDTFLVIGSFSATTDLHKLVSRRKMGMTARAPRGLKMSSKTLLGYKELRDPITGKAIAQVPDETLAPLWAHVAELILEGVAWHNLETELFERYGDVNPKTGKRFGVMAIRSVIYAATFWGNTASHYRSPSAKNRQRGGAWLFDDREPVPEGVVIHRNTHPAIYSGQLAERIKAELKRRMLMYGKRRPENTAAFSGLLVCNSCGYYMVRDRSTTNAYRGWRCDSRYSKSPTRPLCTNHKQINEKKVQAWFNDAMEKMLAYDDPEKYFATHTDQALPKLIASLNESITNVQAEMRRLGNAIRTVDEDNPAWVGYTVDNANAGKRLKSLQEQLIKAERQQISADRPRRKQAFAEIKAMTLPKFWQLPNVKVNQLLLWLFDDQKVYVKDGIMEGLTDAPNRRRLPRMTP